MREVDRLMVEEIGISLLQMMETAGGALARQARIMLGGELSGRRIIVLAGRGGNGGGGMVATRRLSNWGAEVSVILGQSRAALRGVPGHQLAILDRMGLELQDPDGDADSDLRGADLIIDALIGYSLRGSPKEPIGSLIRAANDSGVPILALDLPSGLDGDTGRPADPTIRATRTLTLALPKVGLLQPRARENIGELFVADLSVPSLVYRRLGLNVGPVFERSDIIPVTLPVVRR